MEIRLTKIHNHEVPLHSFISIQNEGEGYKSCHSQISRFITFCINCLAFDVGELPSKYQLIHFVALLYIFYILYSNFTFCIFSNQVLNVFNLGC